MLLALFAIAASATISALVLDQFAVRADVAFATPGARVGTVE
jgi:hypothetical protein